MSVKHKNVELINLKCMMLNIPKIFQVFKGMIDSLEEIRMDKFEDSAIAPDDLPVIASAIKEIVKDEFLSFELRMVA